MVDDAWLALVRVARDAGDVSSLLPPGIGSLYDAPYTFVEAVRMALFYLSFENLPKEERPPKKIWLDGERMEVWWSEVERQREEKYGGQGGGGGNKTDMHENQLLRQMFTGRNFRG